MRYATPILLSLIACLFILSGLSYALFSDDPRFFSESQMRAQQDAQSQLDRQGAENLFASDFGNANLGEVAEKPLSEMFLNPPGPLFWALAIAVWLSAATYVLRLTGWLRPMPRAAEPKPPLPESADRDELLNWFDAGDVDEAALAPAAVIAPEQPRPSPAQPIEVAALVIGLGSATIWPWIFPIHPVAGFLMAALMLAAILCAAMTRPSRPEGLPVSMTLGILAGWATLVTCALFATFLERKLGASGTLSALIALLICAIAAANIQLHLGSPFSYSATVMWGLFGMAMASISSDSTIATAAVLAIAFVAVAVIRVTT